MKRNQYILIFSSIVLVLILFYFGKTTKPAKQNLLTETTKTATTDVLTAIISQSKQKLTIQQSNSFSQLEKKLAATTINDDKIHIYHQLATFWKDSAKVFELYAFYTAEAAKLDNSEKNLTFAAQLFIDNLLIESEPAMQNWLATNGKVLLEKALSINPNNDSSKIGLGACYILGNISNQPMQGILPVREIATKNPDNLYAQLILGLGGKKSGQYDKAIERFGTILQKNSTNLEAMMHLAECFDLKGDKKNAIVWYNKIKQIIPNNEVKKELQNRINQLTD